jgi:hypothetical protein
MALLSQDGALRACSDPRKALAHHGLAVDRKITATTALQQTPIVDADWRAEFMQDLAVLRSKLDILRTLMNGR